MMFDKVFEFLQRFAEIHSVKSRDEINLPSSDSIPYASCPLPSAFPDNSSFLLNSSSFVKDPITQRSSSPRRRCAIAIVSAAICLIGVTERADAKEIELKVGIVQRFGEEANETISISSQGGSLDLRFTTKNGKAQALKTKSVKLEIVQQPIPTPIVEEKLVLSDRATFETAEHSAEAWKKLGVEIEITQPGRWQVWAKRDVYNTPLLRLWLLQSLQQKGYTRPHLQTKTKSTQPEVSFIVAGNTYQVTQLQISSPSNPILVNKGKNNSSRLLYEGGLKIQPNAYGNFTVVNQVPLETYLRGVVPYEIGPGAPQKAIEAQAILARTYALRNLRRFQADGYELCATVHCQVYKGLSGATRRTDKAIAATKNLVLTYDRELIDALYHSTSGGVTAPFSDIWDGAERSYLQPRIDSPARIWDLSKLSLADKGNLRRFIATKAGFNETRTSRVFRWSRVKSLKRISKDLQEYLEITNHPLADLSAVKRMEVSERSPSGRILTLVVETDRGIVELHKTEVRSALSGTLSTLFYLEPIYSASKVLQGYKYIGGGFGHGVGMSQYGSYNLARLGWSAPKILEFYYPGTTLEPVDDRIVFWQE